MLPRSIILIELLQNVASESTYRHHRIANFVRDLRRHLSHGGKTLGAHHHFVIFLQLTVCCSHIAQAILKFRIEP